MTDVDPLLEGDQGKSAAATVKLPAIFLLVLSGAGMLFALLGMFVPQQGPPPGQEIPPGFEAFMDFMQGPGKLLVNGCFLVLNGLILLGAVKMLNLASRGLAMLACILALVNVQCCCLTLPFGIWGLMVLNEEKVKAAFDQTATPGF